MPENRIDVLNRAYEINQQDAFVAYCKLYKITVKEYLDFLVEHKQMDIEEIEGVK